MTARTLLSVALVAGCSLFSTALFADVTYYVAPGGDGTDPTSGDLTKAYAHPQTAIDQAKGTDPIVVKIAAGTYKVRDYATDTTVLNITKSNVSIEAIDSKQVIIDGQQISDNNATLGTKLVNRCVTVSSGLTGVKVSGLVFRDGTMKYNGGKTASSALVASGTFEDCEFYGYCFRRCHWFHFEGTAVARRCLFTTSNATSSNAPSGQYGLNVIGNAVIDGSTVEGIVHYPSANNWNAVHVGGSAVVTNCVIRNTTSGTVSGLQTVGYGSQAGVVYMDGGTLVDSVVTNNLCYGYGGGVYVGAKTVKIKDCVLWGNRATAVGNDIYVKSGVSPTITGTTASDLTTDENGNTNFDPTSDFCTSDSIAVGKVPFKVTFRNKTGVSATWDFGDGSAAATGVTPEHTYTSAGTYTVKMTIGGKTTTRTDYIVATPAKMYVAKDGSGTKPYDTPAKAAVHPQDAIDLAPAGAGTEIEIDDGKYEVRQTTDLSVLEVAKNGLTLRAKNGDGHVWLDSKRDCKNGMARRNVIIGGGYADVTFDGLVFTNGWHVYNTGCGPAVALVGSGAFTNCTFDLYCFQRNIGIVTGGTATYDYCRFTSVAVANQSCQSLDYGIDVDGSVKMRNCVFKGLDRSGYDAAFPFIYLKSANAELRNCLVTGYKGGKSASTKAIGAIYASDGTIENCTIVGNTVTGGKGGGAYLTGSTVTFRNNIVWGNAAASNPDIYAADYSRCTYSASGDLSPSTEENPTGNVKLSADDPGFTDAAHGNYSLKVESTVTGKGLVQDWMTGAKDLAGLPRLYQDSVSMGAYEPQGRSDALTGDFAATTKTVGTGTLDVTFMADISGGTEAYEYNWNFGDGTVTGYISDANPTHRYSSIGVYSVTLDVRSGAKSKTFGPKEGLVTILGEICYARPDQNGTPPYATWETASSNLAALIKLGPHTILATNGTYKVHQFTDATGLLFDDPIRLVSVEGPEKTQLRGDHPKTDARIVSTLVTLRHAGASVEGFSLQRGYPPTVVATAGLLANCIVTNQCKNENQPLNSFSGTAIASNCVFDATGLDWSHPNGSMHPVFAEGTAKILGCVAKNLVLTGTKLGANSRGGVFAQGSAVVRNCFVDNVRLDVNASTCGGIIATGSAVVDNCTIRNCWVKNDPLGALVLREHATARNNIVWGNTAGADHDPLDVTGVLASATFQNNLVGAGELPAQAEDCLPLGTDPKFVDDGAGYRIGTDSPCWNAGRYLDWCSRRSMAVDLDGQERRCNRPDIGCFEVQRNLGLQLLVR